MSNKKNSMSSIVSQAFWIFSPSTNCIIVAYAVFVIIIVETVKRITANVVFIFHRGTNLLGLQIMCHLLLDQMLVMNPSNARQSGTTSWFCCASDFRDWSSLRLLFSFFTKILWTIYKRKKKKTSCEQKYTYIYFNFHIAKISIFKAIWAVFV